MMICQCKVLIFDISYTFALKGLNIIFMSIFEGRIILGNELQAQMVCLALPLLILCFWFRQRAACCLYWIENTVLC